MGKIKFDSVKLPYQLTEFARVVKGQNLTEATVKMKATLKQPQHRIPINGYFQKCSLTKPALNRSETRYVMQRVISQTKLGSKN